MASISEILRGWLLEPLTTQLHTMREELMADITNVLTEVRDGINGPLRAKIEAVLARNAQLEAQVAGQAPEEARESQAAGELRDAYNEVVLILEPEDVPVDPVPPLQAT